jgi:hypothetical protein
LPADTPRRLATLHGTEPTEHLGWTMAAAGDVNGDGLADLLVGDTREGYYPGERRCYLYHGQAELDTLPDLVILQSETDPDGDDHFGAVVCGGHDVNGDGFDDVLITSPWWCWWTGKVYLYHGGACMDAEPDVAIAAWGSSWITSFWDTDLRGRLTGDVNGDGYDELVCLVGSVSIDAGAHLYFGGAPMDSTHDLSMQGPGYPDLILGSDLADGDVNADAHTDIVVCTYGGDAGQEADAAWAYYGGVETDAVPDLQLGGCGEVGCGNAYSPGDIDGDGFGDIAISEGPDSGHVYLYFGGSAMDGLADITFPGSVSSDVPRIAGGDLDMDGYADLLVAQTGRLTGYFGGTDYAPGSEPQPDFEITEPDSFGKALAFLGDMTGDGWPEFAVSDPEGPGAIYIYTLAPEAPGEDLSHNAALTRLSLAPNPARGPVTISYWRAGPGDVRVGVYDLTGRLVRTLFSGAGGTGVDDVWWDGTDADGRHVSPGVYVVQVRAAGAGSVLAAAGLQSARFVLSR